MQFTNDRVTLFSTTSTIDAGLASSYAHMVSLTGDTRADAGRHESASLLTLSPELIVEIASHIISPEERCSRFRNSLYLVGSRGKNLVESDDVQKSLGNMRLACRYLGQVLKHMAFKVLVFDFNSSRLSLDDIESRLKSLTDPSNLSHIHANFLRVHGPNPVRANRDPHSLDESLSNLLEAAVSSLKNLRFIGWDVDSIDHVSAPFMEALSSHPTVKDIALHIPETSLFPSRLQLNRLSGLRSLTIERIRPDFFDLEQEDDEKTIKGHIAQIISHSPLLSCFNLKFSHDHDHFFRDIMMKLPDHREFINLSQLRLHTISLSEADQHTFDLLKSLKSLHLDELFCHYNRRIPADRGLWEKMRIAAIRLNELTVNAVSKGLLDYLVSFSTLEMLHITLMADGIPKHYKSDGRLFYHTVLPLHGLILVLQPREQDIKHVSHFGLLYKRCSPERAFFRTSLVLVRPATIPQCLPFLMDSIISSGYEQLDSLSIYYPFRRPGYQYFQGHSGAQKWLAGVEVSKRQKLPYPKQVSL